MTDDALLDKLAAEEGFLPYAYDDGDGQPVVPGKVMIGHVSIWYGLCLEQGRVPKLPDAMPMDALRFVAQNKYAELVGREPWILEQPDEVRLALALMAYQLGARGVINFKLMMGALRAGDRARAAAEAIDSQWAKQTPARAERVSELIRGAS